MSCYIANASTIMKTLFEHYENLNATCFICYLLFTIVNNRTLPGYNHNKIKQLRQQCNSVFQGWSWSGISRWFKRLGWVFKKNLKASTPIKHKAPNGTYQVIIRFIVSRNGDISDIVSETRHGFGMEAEVIRVIKKCPKWNPAYQNGRAVNAYRRQPVTFIVSDK